MHFQEGQLANRRFTFRNVFTFFFAILWQGNSDSEKESQFDFGTIDANSKLMTDSTSDQSYGQLSTNGNPGPTLTQISFGPKTAVPEKGQSALSES